MEKGSPIESEKITNFEIEHQEILDKYAQNLRPPHPELKLSVVIPSLAELHSGNFWRLLRSAATQHGVDTKSYEFLVVVNNSLRAAKSSEGTGDTQTRYEGSSAELLRNRFEENQRHIQILSLYGSDLSDEQLAIELQALKLTKEEQEVFFLARTRQVNIQAIDCSSEDKAFSQSEQEATFNPIGYARNVGGHVAYERFRKIKRGQGIIDFIDGDVFLKSKYVAGLLEQYDGSSGVFIKPIQVVTAEYPDLIPGESVEKRMSSFMSYIHDGLVFSRGNIEYTGTRFSGGSRVAVRVQNFRAVNGYPYNTFSEDFAFLNKFVRSPLAIEYLESTEMVLSDRGRIGSTDGQFRMNVPNFSDTVSLDKIREKLDDSNMPILTNWLEQYKKNSVGLSEQDTEELAVIRKRYFRRVNIRRRAFLSSVDRITHMVCERLIAGENTSEPFGKRMDDFLKRNPLILDMIGTTAQSELQKHPEADIKQLSTLVREFGKHYFSEVMADVPAVEPDYFANPEPSKIRNYIHLLKTMEQFEIRKNRISLP